MGTWGIAPWDNDAAADWFGEFFDRTRVAPYIEATLKLDLENHHEEIRAATYLLLSLGHIYVWPIDDLNRHLELRATRLEEMLDTPEWLELMGEAPEIIESVREEALELRSRIKVISEEE